MKRPLLQWTEKGLYCPQGDFYIDPLKPVERAVITHAHSDHARPGNEQYFCVKESEGLIRLRLGQQIRVGAFAYGQTFHFGCVRLSFHSAGHMLGSAQVRLECEGQVWVVSGDYKREFDPTCPAFEVVPCDVFVTEATFGTPSFVWEIEAKVGEKMASWWRANRAQGFHSLLLGYSIGKSQRILGELLPHLGDEAVYIHPVVQEAVEVYRAENVTLPRTIVAEKKLLEEGLPAGSLLVAPPAVVDGPWETLLGKRRVAFVSGWMNKNGQGPGRMYDEGFIMSDHADWPALLRTVQETGARRVYVQHRGVGALVRHLRGQGLEADPVSALGAPESNSDQLNFFPAF